MLVAFALISASACSGASSDRLPPVDREAALKVSDEFMSDLIADRIGEAVAKFEPAFAAGLGAGEAESGVRSLFGYCGQPLDSELAAEAVGVKVYPDGRRKSTHQFVYSAATTTHAKGECVFAVTMVTEATGPRVTNFGPLKSPKHQAP
jgi:hypothetical protein